MKSLNHNHRSLNKKKSKVSFLDFILMFFMIGLSVFVVLALVFSLTAQVN